MSAYIAVSDHPVKTDDRYYRLGGDRCQRYNAPMKLRLKELRWQRGWTQREVADMAGMSQSYYTELENHRKQINANRLESLARVFGVEPHQLIANDATGTTSKLVQAFSGLSEVQREAVLKMIDTLTGK